MNITWLGHSAFEVKLPGGEVVLLDPWMDGNPKYPTGHQLTRCDAMAISHGHGDHSSGVVALSKQFPSAKIVCAHELSMYFDGKGASGVTGMAKGGTIDLGFVRITMTQAIHSSSIDFEGGAPVYAGEPVGFVLEAAGKRLYFAGDTCVFGDMRLIAEIHGPLDAACLPIGDHYTMGPKEAAYACRMLRPKIVIPMHWGTFPLLTGTPQALRTLIADLPGTSVAEISPGGSVSI